MMEHNKKCKDKVANSLASRMEDLEMLWGAYCNGEEETEIGSFNEYGLCFDYVSAGTFDDQDEGYFRYQLSYGGPTEEFRFYCDPTLECYKIEFWYLDWFDGAHKVLRGDNQKLMLEIFEFFKECGTTEYLLEEARG